MFRIDVRRRLRKASVGLVVVGLHLAGLLAWWAAEHNTQPAHGMQRSEPIAVWLQALPTPDAQQPAPTRRPQHMPANGLPAQRDKPPTQQNPAADAGATPTANGVPMPAQANSLAEVPAPPAVAPLNLNLSRQAIASAAPPSFAEQSPFHGRLPATVERQIATAAGESGPWTEERIDNDHVRFRRGNTCVNLQRPRAAIIDPFNEAMARIPWRTNGPEECR